MRLLLLTLATLFITACGGGGGGESTSTPTPPPVSSPGGDGNGGGDEDNGDEDNGDEDNGDEDNDGDTTPDPDPTPDPTPTPEPLTITLSESEIETNDLSQSFSITMNINGAEGSYVITPSLSPSIEGASFEMGDDVVEVNIDDVLVHDPDVTLTVSVTDGDNRKADASTVFRITNVSGANEIDESRKVIDAINNYTGEEIELFDTYFTLLADVTPGAGDYNRPNTPAIVEAIDLTDIALAIENNNNGYLQGNIDETEISGAVEDALQDSATLLMDATEAINVLYANALGDGNTLPITQLYYDELSGKVSLFAGNPALGTTDEVFVFNQNYRFLNDITFPESTVCPVE